MVDLAERIKMIEVEEMGNKEIEGLLKTIGYGHLACSRDNEPYVVPIHYVYAKPYVYIYTTLGKKAEIINENPRICLQIEDVIDQKNWKSAIVYGTAEQVTDEPERQTALDAITETNPTLTPAVSIRWMDNWVRENIEVIYRVTPTQMTGRTSVLRSEESAPIIPGKKLGQSNIY